MPIHAPTLIATSEGTSILGRDLLVILATAGLVTLLLSRLRVATIPGFLVAGALIGPYALGFVPQSERVEAIGALSTVLLMFTIGLHLDLSTIRSGLVSLATLTIASTLVMIGVAYGPAQLVEGSSKAGLALAMAIAMTATAVPLRMLEQRREMHSTHGRLAFGIALFQDLLAVAMLAILPALAPRTGASGEGSSILDRLGSASLAFGVVIAMIVVGRFALPRLLREAARAGGEVLLVLSASLALGAAVLTSRVGFSPEMGAFLAGFLLAATPVRHQVAGQLTPMRDLFLAVFFTSVGMRLPVGLVAEQWWLVLLGVVGLVALRVLGIGGVSWAFGASPRVAILAACTLASAGEFSLVLISQSSTKGVISADAAGLAIAIVVASNFLAPVVMFAGARVARRAIGWPVAPWVKRSALRGDAPASHVAANESPSASRPKHAIIAGFGPVGRAVADKLDRQGFVLTVIDLNPRTIEKQIGLGRKMFYGDASNPAVLESAGVHSADAVILTMPDEEAMLRACRVVRQMRPDVFVAARANALSRALQARQLGADHTIVEEMATADAMAREVLLMLEHRASGRDIGPKLYEMGDLT